MDCSSSCQQCVPGQLLTLLLGITSPDALAGSYEGIKGNK